MARELCLCETCVRDRQSQHNAEKTPVSYQEYISLVFAQVKEIRAIATEEKTTISLHDAAIQARQIISDFYEIEK